MFESFLTSLIQSPIVREPTYVLTPEATTYFSTLLEKIIDSKCFQSNDECLKEFRSFVDDCINDNPDEHASRLEEWKDLIEHLRSKYPSEDAEMLFTHAYAMIVLVDQDFEQYHEPVSEVFEVSTQFLVATLMEQDFFPAIKDLDDFSKFASHPPSEETGFTATLSKVN